MKKIDGFKEKYTISRDGKITNTETGKELKLSTCNYGYQVVTLSTPKKSKTYKVHQLVAEAYLKVPSSLKGKKLVVNHIDGNKTNNKVSNLEYVDYTGNLEHAYDKDLRTPKGLSRDHNPNSKYDTKTVDKMLKRVWDGEATGDIADEYGYSRETVSRLFKNYFGTSVSRKKDSAARKEEHLGKK